MGRRRSKPVWWHVTSAGWFQFGPAGVGIGNVGNDIVLVLVDTEENLGNEPLVPEYDEFVVERVIGQWHLTGTEAVGADRYVFERVYVVEATAATVATRNLTDWLEADTSFMYTNVTQWTSPMNGKTWGNWAQSRLDLASVSTGVQNTGMHGQMFRDIKVGRALREGEALIYHWQLSGGAPVDDAFNVKCWFRTLIRER